MINPIFNANLEFLPYMKYFCTKSCMVQLLQYYEVENAILYIKAGFSLKLFFSDSGFGINGINSLLPAADAILSSGFSDSFDEVYEKNQNQLLQGTPPIVLVDTFYLPYRREYQKIHASHSAIFAGFDDNAVYLIDYYPPHYFRGSISIEEYRKSRCSANPKDLNPFSGIPIKNYWYNIKKNKLENTINDCIGDSLLEIVEKAPDSQKELRREEALIYLYAYFAKYKNSSVEDKKNLMLKLHDSLFVYQNTSCLMIHYFNKLKDKIRIPQKIISLLQELNVSLTQLNALCMRGAVSKSEYSFACICQMFPHLINKQAMFLKSMDDWIMNDLCDIYIRKDTEDES